MQVFFIGSGTPFYALKRCPTPSKHRFLGDIEPISLRLSAVDDLLKCIWILENFATLIEQAKKFRAKIVLPEVEDERILKAAAKIISLRLADIVLLGNSEKITSILKESNMQLDLNRREVVDPITDPIFAEYADSLYQLRKDDGLKVEAAMFSCAIHLTLVQ